MTSRPYVLPCRYAILVLFFCNGLLVGNWAPTVPAFFQRLALETDVYGLLVLTFGLGAVIVMPLVGKYITRHGSYKLCLISSLLLAPMPILLIISPNIATAMVMIFLTGGFLGGMDVAINANAVAVEKHSRCRIMSTGHGFWSLGGVGGAFTGGYMIDAFGVVVNSVLASAFFTALSLFALPGVLRDTPDDYKKNETKISLSIIPKNLSLYLIGLAALFSMLLEGSVLDWSALYLRESLNTPTEKDGWAYGAFSVSMALMCFCGDALRARINPVALVRLSSGIAFSGFLIAGSGISFPIVILGFAIAGLGSANIAPIAFVAAENLPGLSKGVGISVVTMIGYSGLLFMPASIGLIARYIDLGTIFMVLSLFMASIIFLSGQMKFAENQDSKKTLL